jgi:hypothetical protein
MHAQMTSLQAPCSQKCRQHGLTYIPTGWTTRIQGSSNLLRENLDRCHTHTGFNVCKIRPSTSLNSSKFAATSVVSIEV